MEKLTENFYLQEFTKSPTALKRGIDNTPNQEQKDNLKALCVNVLQPLRDWYNKSISVNSGFRCLALNTAIGGSETSEHPEGKAGDIDTINDNAILFNYIKEHLPFTQLIWEYGDDKNPAWIHTSYDPNNLKKQVLKCEKINGKTVYTDIT